jgi:hypothetical protein
LWRSQPCETYLQELTLLLLQDCFGRAEYRHKRRLGGAFDRFLLNTFYTLNILKTCNKYARNFTNFLNSNYSFCELFLYVSLKHVSVLEGGEEKVSSAVIKKIIRILQVDDANINTSTVSFSKESLEL